MTSPIPVHGLVLGDLRKRGLYWRATEKKDGRLWDVLSQAPMSTEFALTRFLVPTLAKTGWAMFLDCDMLVRENLARIFDLVDNKYAVMVVKHEHNPHLGKKMDNQIQTPYARKNWSSMILYNCDHPANKRLDVNYVNETRGLHLHQFCWLRDEEIGGLNVEWNWLVGHSDRTVEPKIVHFTDGIPSMPGYSNAPYAEEWWEELKAWALA